MTPQYWIAHPGRNKAHRFGEGRARWKQKLPDFRTGEVREFVMLGPKNPSRWVPHQGRRECARRLRRPSPTPTEQQQKD